MKAETKILLFYVLYFIWLFSVTYLTFNTQILNYFTFFVSAVYILFLREKGDIYWFVFAGFAPVVFSLFSLKGWVINFTTDNIQYFPPWLALAWATTIVSLRKLYFVINK